MADKERTATAAFLPRGLGKGGGEREAFERPEPGGLQPGKPGVFSFTVQARTKKPICYLQFPKSHRRGTLKPTRANNFSTANRECSGALLRCVNTLGELY